MKHHFRLVPNLFRAALLGAVFCAASVLTTAESAAVMCGYNLECDYYEDNRATIVYGFEVCAYYSPDGCSEYYDPDSGCSFVSPGPC